MDINGYEYEAYEQTYIYIYTQEFLEIYMKLS